MLAYLELTRRLSRQTLAFFGASPVHPSFTARHPLTRLDCCPPPCLSTRPLHQSVPPASPRLPSIEDLRSPVATQTICVEPSNGCFRSASEYASSSLPLQLPIQTTGRPPSLQTVSPNPVPPLATSLFVSPSSASSLDLTRHQNSTVLHHTAHLQKPSPAAKLARTQEVLQRQIRTASSSHHDRLLASPFCAKLAPLRACAPNQLSELCPSVHQVCRYSPASRRLYIPLLLPWTT